MNDQMVSRPLQTISPLQGHSLGLEDVGLHTCTHPPLDGDASIQIAGLFLPDALVSFLDQFRIWDDFQGCSEKALPSHTGLGVPVALLEGHEQSPARHSVPPAHASQGGTCTWATSLCQLQILQCLPIGFHS